MTPDAKIIAVAGAKSLLLAAIVALTGGLFIIDVLLLDNRVGEGSCVEVTQEIILFATCLVFCAGARHPAYFAFCSLLAGFFGCMLIRELDALLDLIRHGFWKYPAFAIALVAIALAWCDRDRCLARFAEFTHMPCFGLMIAGLVVILVFSRLFGLPMLWHHVLDQAETNFVKRATEETSELLGYCLCFAASIEYLRTIRRSPESLA